MPISYQQKDEAEHLWKENRERIQLAIRQMANRLADVVLTEVNREFVQALHEGQLLSFEPSRSEILSRLVAASKRALDEG